MLLAFSRRAAGVCAAPLAAPGGRALTRRVFGLLRPLGFLAPIPASPLVELDAAGECRAVLWFLQAALGVVAPLARRAIVESRLFALHQVGANGPACQAAAKTCPAALLGWIGGAA